MKVVVTHRGIEKVVAFIEAYEKFTVQEPKV